MERSWKLSGGYANWTMTLTTAPPDGVVEPFVDEWVTGPLDRIGHHFFDMVDLVECCRLLDEPRR